MGDDQVDNDTPPTRRFLGTVDVDSGTLLLGDALYVLPSERDGRPGVDWAVILDAPSEPATPLVGGLALLLGSFGGDGTYPVFAELDEDGTIARVTVEFVEPEEE